MANIRVTWLWKKKEKKNPAPQAPDRCPGGAKPRTVHFLSRYTVYSLAHLYIIYAKQAMVQCTSTRSVTHKLNAQHLPSHTKNRLVVCRSRRACVRDPPRWTSGGDAGGTRRGTYCSGVGRSQSLERQAVGPVRIFRRQLCGGIQHQNRYQRAARTCSVWRTPPVPAPLQRAPRPSTIPPSIPPAAHQKHNASDVVHTQRVGQHGVPAVIYAA